MYTKGQPIIANKQIQNITGNETEKKWNRDSVLVISGMENIMYLHTTQLLLRKAIEIQFRVIF